MRYPNFVGPSYASTNPLALFERTVNFCPERIPVPGAKNAYILNSAPGVTSFATSNETNGRGIYALADGSRGFAMIGRTLHEVNPGNTVTPLGTMPTDQYPAQMVDNGDGGGQLAVGSGGQVDVLDLTSGVITTNVAPGIPITFLGMLDGYFLGLDIASGTLYASALFAGLTWDPTQFLQRSAAPDPWISMLVRDAVIYLIGAKTGDVLFNAGNVPYPFAPVPGVRIRHGIAASFSLTDLDSGPAWVSQNERGAGQVVQVQAGYRSTPVSTPAIDHAISQYARIDDAVGWGFQLDGYEHLALNFPSARKSWGWMPALGSMGWYERGYWDQTTATYDTWGPQYHAYMHNKHLVLDHRSGVVYRLASDVYTDTDSDLIRRLRIAPGLTNELKTVCYNKVGLYLETGIGLQSGQGEDPQVMFRASGDAGRTWSPIRMRSAGAVGEYRTRCEWNRVGPLRDALFEFSFTDPVPWRLVDGFIETELGTS